MLQNRQGRRSIAYWTLQEFIRDSLQYLFAKYVFATWGLRLRRFGVLHPCSVRSLLCLACEAWMVFGDYLSSSVGLEDYWSNQRKQSLNTFLLQKGYFVEVLLSVKYAYIWKRRSCIIIKSTLLRGICSCRIFLDRSTSSLYSIYSTAYEHILYIPDVTLWDM